MRYVVGIDGGGTKSLLQAMDLEGRTIFETRGGPTNIYATSEQEVEAVITELMQTTEAESGLRLADCAALCLGSAGVDRPYEKEYFSGVFRRCGVQGTLIITHDAEAALVAGSGKQEGIVLISGTGSFGFGRDLAGSRARTGGWGHLFGDEGGGYYISMNAIRAAVRSEDGREPPTLLLPMLMKEIGLEQPQQFLHFVYKKAGKTDIAALAKVVAAAHEAGDAKATAILEDAASELHLMAKTLVRKLGFADREVTLVANGSVFSHIDYLYDYLRELVRVEYPRMTVVKPTLPISYGAALIALQSLVE